MRLLSIIACIAFAFKHSRSHYFFLPDITLPCFILLGEIVIKQGDTGDEFFIITEGKDTHSLFSSYFLY
jgi:hypothetical protein